MKVKVQREAKWICNCKEWEMDEFEALAYMKKNGYKFEAARDRKDGSRMLYFGNSSKATRYNILVPAK